VIDWITQSFAYIPDSYKLDFEIILDDPEGYAEAELEKICRSNVLLEMKMHSREAKRENRLAISLCAVGLLMILISIAVTQLWTAESRARDIVLFILDILATVPFWGAADICFVGNRKIRQRAANFVRRFHAIRFAGKQQPGTETR